MARIIDQALLDEVSAEARRSPRLRKNRNFHAGEAEASHRLLNAIEPGSYIPPHRHLDSAKDESILVLRGALGAVFFDDAGAATETARLAPDGAAVGINIPSGVYHTVFALEAGTVFFEAKAGPYAPLRAEEKAPWAPAEGDAGAADYLQRLGRLVAGA
jgi:cupin fold WbuC family metalloprotein